MKILVEVPDECAAQVRDCLTWLRSRKILSSGEVLTVGESQGQPRLAVRLMSMKIVAQGSQGQMNAMGGPAAADSGNVRRHIQFKLAAGELAEPVGQRMLAALDTGAAADYAALYRAAVFRDPPAVVYHVAPVAARARIQETGLEARQPGHGGNWEDVCLDLEVTQPPGVYVTGEPDTRGVFAHWAAWDIWEITRGEIPWRHDNINPGCWSLDENVPPGRIRLHGTFRCGTARR